MPKAIELTADQLRARGGKKWRTYGDDALPAWLADMDFLPPESVTKAVLRAVEQGAFVYPADDAYTSVTYAFAERMRSCFGWAADPARAVLVSDLVQALTTTVIAFSRPGDGVLVLTPIYPPFRQSVEASGRTVVGIPLVDTAAGFAIDFELLSRQAGRADVRLLLLCNPHNPTGRVFTRAELRRLYEIAAEHDIVVVSDEVHADLVFPPHRHTVFAAVEPTAGARTVTLQSATKTFNIGGLRCAVVHFGSEVLRLRFMSEFPERLLGRVSGVSAAATVAAWREGQDWLADVREVLETNREIVRVWVRAHEDAVRWHVPEGTYFAWLDFSRWAPAAADASSFLVESARVALSPGRDFDADCAAWARLNFATSNEILEAILDRISSQITIRNPNQGGMSHDHTPRPIHHGPA